MSLDYVNMDYESFRTAMINSIPSKTSRWTDFSPSDFGIVVIELLSAKLDYLAYAVDVAVNESALETAYQEPNVLAHCKTLGYTPRLAIPARVYLTFTVTGHSTALIIPAGTQVSTKGSSIEEELVFETDEDLRLEVGQLEGTVSATQGETIIEELLGSSTGAPSQKFKLNYPGLIEGSAKVFVNEGNGFAEWVEVQSFLGGFKTSTTFRPQPDGYGSDWICFGDGYNGKIPAVGLDNLKVTYRIGGGEKGNVGLNTISELRTPVNGVDSVTNAEVPFQLGIDREGIEEMKRNAPLNWSTQERAVTEDDFEYLATRVPGVARASAKVGAGWNEVIIAIAPTVGGQPTNELKAAARSYLEVRKMITSVITVVGQEYSYVYLTVDAQIKDTYVQDFVRNSILEVISEQFSLDLKDFDTPEFVSVLYQKISLIDGVEYCFISRMHIRPDPTAIVLNGSPTWSAIDVLSTNNVAGSWKVTMTSATEFKVELASGSDWLPKGTGVFGVEFTTTGDELRFTITAGDVPCSTNDYWTFISSRYLDNLQPETGRILQIENMGTDVVLNLSGGEL